MSALTISAIISMVLSIWVYNDAKSCGMSSPVWWAIGTFFLTIIVFPIYLIIHISKQPNDTSADTVKHDYEIVEANTKKLLRFGLLFLAFCSAILFSTHDSSPDTSTHVAPASKYMNGYLKSNTTWVDEVGDIGTARVYSNSKPVRIEIWNLDIVMANGQNNRNIVMIYFLEGKYQGRWGYTLRAYTEIVN